MKLVFRFLFVISFYCTNRQKCLPVERPIFKTIITLKIYNKSIDDGAFLIQKQKENIQSLYFCSGSDKFLLKKK